MGAARVAVLKLPVRVLYDMYNDAERREQAVLLIVHVYRMENENGEEETIRIISAREANKRERRIYIQQAAE